MRWLTVRSAVQDTTSQHTQLHCITPHFFPGAPSARRRLKRRRNRKRKRRVRVRAKAMAATPGPTTAPTAKAQIWAGAWRLGGVWRKCLDVDAWFWLHGLSLIALADWNECGMHGEMILVLAIDLTSILCGGVHIFLNGLSLVHAGRQNQTPSTRAWFRCTDCLTRPFAGTSAGQSWPTVWIAARSKSRWFLCSTLAPLLLDLILLYFRFSRFYGYNFFVHYCENTLWLTAPQIIFENEGMGPCLFCGERLDIDAARGGGVVALAVDYGMVELWW